MSASFGCLESVQIGSRYDVPEAQIAWLYKEEVILSSLHLNLIPSLSADFKGNE